MVLLISYTALAQTVRVQAIKITSGHGTHFNFGHEQDEYLQTKSVLCPLNGKLF